MTDLRSAAQRVIDAAEPLMRHTDLELFAAIADLRSALQQPQQHDLSTCPYRPVGREFDPLGEG